MSEGTTTVRRRRLLLWTIATFLAVLATGIVLSYLTKGEPFASPFSFAIGFGLVYGVGQLFFGKTSSQAQEQRLYRRRERERYGAAGPLVVLGIALLVFVLIVGVLLMLGTIFG